MTKKYATYKEKRQIEDLLLLHSTPIGKDDSARMWKDGWTFATIASYVNPHLTPHHAKRVAEDLELTFRAVEVKTVEQRLIDVEAMLEAALERIGELEALVTP